MFEGVAGLAMQELALMFEDVAGLRIIVSLAATIVLPLVKARTSCALTRQHFVNGMRGPINLRVVQVTQIHFVI